MFLALKYDLFGGKRQNKSQFFSIGDTRYWTFDTRYSSILWKVSRSRVLIDTRYDILKPGPDMISQRSCWDIMFEDNFCQIKVWMHSKIDQTSLFCAFLPLPRKKAWKHKNTFFLRVFFTLLPNTLRSVKVNFYTITLFHHDYFPFLFLVIHLFL